MTKMSDAEVPNITLEEIANDGSDLTNPSADHRRLFLGEDGALHLKDSSGTVTDVASGGSVAADDVTVTDSGGYYTGSDIEAALAELGPERSGTIQTFSPTWTSSGSAPSLGNGVLTGHYQKVADKLYWFNIHFQYGSTSSAGTGFYSFGNLPFTIKSTSPTEQTVAAQVRDSGTTRFACTAALTAGATSVGQIIVGDGTGARQWSGTMPMTLANGDQCMLEGVVATD